MNSFEDLLNSRKPTNDSIALPVGQETFSQIREDLTAPTLMSKLQQIPDIRKRMTEKEIAAFDTILSEIGTPDEYSSISEYIMRALPYIKLTYGTGQIQEPIMPSEETVAMLMTNRFLM